MIEKILRKKTISWTSRNILRIFQHISIAIVAGIVFYVVTGSAFTGGDGKEYRISQNDYGHSYEESKLFSDILKSNLSNIAAYAAVSTLLETDGEYNADKTIDVTAFVNRNSMLQGDYITAVYRVSDLIKWAQNGFEYDEKKYTASESTNFFGNTTVYTHLMKNNVESGMNSFLSSQLDNNTVRTNATQNSLYDGSGVHTILVPRYKTIYGEDIEDIVSNWEDYNDLCANITEAASTMATNYENYSDYKKKYGFYKSNLRFYITRTINARTEVFTNVESLKRNTTGINIGDTFKTYGTYIYYCPYEIDYSTNTSITEEEVRNILSSYDYAFPDQMKFYFAVDTGNLSRADDFTLGQEIFDRYMPYFKQFYALILLFSVIYVIVIIHLSIYEGKVEYSDGSIGGLERIDSIPFGLALAICVILIGSLAVVLNYLYDLYPHYFKNIHFTCLIIAGAAFFDDNAISFVFYSTIRRIKYKVFIKNTLLYRFGGVVRKISNKLTIKQNLFLRTFVPYIISVFINFIVVYKLDYVGIAIAAVLDIGIGIFIYNLSNDRVIMIRALEKIRKGELDVKIDTSKVHGSNIYLANELNSIADAVEEAVNRSMRDEKLKADLITNVSHDIKTPLTSIINYVDLLKRENIQDTRAREYIAILENKAQRLRQLTDDLVEASKISSGNITLHPEQINYAEIINQILGEFYEKFADYELTPILKCEKYDVLIMADPRQLYRVIENLLNNVCKYALPGTRVYLDLEVQEDDDGEHAATFSVKNISKNELNIKADELTERFIRGDISRSTEGSGLGLSIAKSLTLAMGGKFEIILDGDLFKVNVTFFTSHFSKGNPSAETSDVNAMR